MENETNTAPIADCVTCGSPSEDCFCRHCDSCNTLQPSFCDNCDKCLDCCTCRVCPGYRCGERVAARQICPNCDRCQDCCDCYCCDGCQERVTELARGECNCCNSCSCSCEKDEPNIRFFSPHKVTFHKAKINEHKHNPSNRFIAVEIEVSSISENTGIDTAVSKWNGGIVKDGSLPDTGFEINTAPASGDTFVSQVTEICKALSNSDAKVTTDCGLHVHVDARDLTYYGIRRLATIYSVIERALFQAVSPSRRESRYCEPCGDRYRNNIGKLTDFKRNGFRADVVESVYGGETDIKNRKRDKYDSARYAALNLHSWYYRGTVECRMFNGTVNADKIIQWGILWALIVDAANTLTDKEIESMINECGSGMVGGKEILFKIIGDNVAIKTFLIERWNTHSIYSSLKESV